MLWLPFWKLKGKMKKFSKIEHLRMRMTLITFALVIPKSQVRIVLDQQVQYGIVSQFSGQHRWGATHLVLDVDLCPLGHEEADHLCK